MKINENKFDFIPKKKWNMLTKEEIKNLSKNHIELKDEIEQNQKHYEKLIDAAADEISNFVEKANIDKISQ